MNEKLERLIRAVYNDETVYVWMRDRVMTMTNSSAGSPSNLDDSRVAVIPCWVEGEIEYRLASWNEQSQDWIDFPTETAFESLDECLRYGAKLQVEGLMRKRDELDAEINKLLVPAGLIPKNSIVPTKTVIPKKKNRIRKKAKKRKPVTWAKTAL